jgi:hypothetical protein
MTSFRRRFRALGVSLLCLFLAAAAAVEDPVKVESRIDPLRLARGAEGKVILKITLKPDIVLSAAASLTVEFEASDELVFPKNFFTAADLSIPRIETGGKEVLDLRKPVEIPLTVNAKARRGVHVLRGRVKYFATSLSGGWCYKSSAKFSATYSTRLAAPKLDP